MNINVGAICRRRAVCVSESATPAEVAALMNQEHVGAVIVTRAERSHPRVVGIITDRDIVRTQLDRVADLSRLGAAKAMTPKPLTFEEREPL